MSIELDTSTPFTRAEGIAAGLTPRQLRGSRYRRIFRNVHVDSSRPATPRQRVLAALKLFDELAWASHASAARLHELPIPTVADEHVSVPLAKHRRHHAGIRTHVGQPWHIATIDGIRASTALLTFVEFCAAAVTDQQVGPRRLRRTSGQTWTLRWRRDCACSSCWRAFPNPGSTSPSGPATGRCSASTTSAIPSSRS